MNLDRWYSFFFEIDCFCLIAFVLLVAVAGVVVFCDDLLLGFKDNDKVKADTIGSRN